MKEALWVFALTWMCCLAACANKKPASAESNTIAYRATTAYASHTDSLVTGKVIEKVNIGDNASESYALYIPLNKSNLKLPVVYCFDPHASGVLPVSKYQTLAEEFGFILVGSNNSKNGNDWATTENIWQHLFTDTQKRLHINKARLYTCGFSGGAKVASYIALMQSGIKGVIANGAGFPDGLEVSDFNFSFTGITGEGDMNMTQLVSMNEALNTTRTPHRLLIFDGKHEWAPENIMRSAFAGWQFDAMRAHVIPPDNAMINNYISNSKKTIDAFIKANRLVKAGQECRLTSDLLKELTNETNWFDQKAASLQSNAVYKKQLTEQEKLLTTEKSMQAGFADHFEVEQMSYWTSTIADLQTKGKTATAEGAMYQRLLAYLSLAFYSFTNQLMNENQNEGARYFDELYKAVDPSNSEAWYFSAILNARSGSASKAETDLQKAVKNGFNDLPRLRQQSEFKRAGVNVSKIISSIPVPHK